MANDKIKTANRQIQSVTYLGIAANVALAAIKLIIGLLANSLAMVFDSFHSISDIITDLAVLFGVHFSSKEPDKEHPYGHGRIETFSKSIIAAFFIFGGALMIHQASAAISKSLYSPAKPPMSSAVLWAAIASIIVKEALYWITRKIAVKTDSSLLYANAWHHRSDALSSIAVVAGFIAIRMGYANGDNIAAVAVGLMIILVGVKIIGECIEEFSESAADSGTITQIKAIIASEDRIHQWHKLRTRNVGREVFLDLHILVDPTLTITEAHEISESLEHSMHKKIARPINITVHIEPDRPEQRK